MEKFIKKILIQKDWLIFLWNGSISYFLRHLSLGIIFASIVVLFSKAFDKNPILLAIKALNYSIINIVYNTNSTPSILVGCAILIILVYVVIKNWQTFVSVSINYIGFYLFGYCFGGIGYKTPLDKSVWITDGTNDFVILNFLLVISLTIVTLDILGIFLIKIILKIVKEFVINFEFKTKIIGAIDISFPRYSNWIREVVKTFYISVKKDLISDAPLGDILQIELIRRSVESNSIFGDFLHNKDRLIGFIKDGMSTEGLSIGISSRSVCIDGSWGTGKTSLVRVVKKEILDGKIGKFLWIDFEPWNFNNKTELIKNFFETLNIELEKTYKIDLQPSLQPYINLITPILESSGFVADIKTFISRLPFINHDDLGYLKKKICKQLKRLPHEIIIVLDDIDRLRYKEIVVVLQLVKQLSDFPNIVFILPFDYERVENLIVNDRGKEYSNFLKKIITDRIRLVNYSFDELKAIFVHHAHKDLKKEREKLESLFEEIVSTKIYPRFEEIRRKQDESEEKVNGENTNKILKPMAMFARKLYKELYPKAKYVEKFVEVANEMGKAVDKYLSDYYDSTQKLIYEILMYMSIVKKNDLSGELRKNSETINQLLRNQGYGEDQTNSIVGENGKMTKFINALENLLILPDIQKLLDDFINDPIINEVKQVNPELNDLINSISSKFVIFSTETINDDKVVLVKNWLVEDFTPREVKRLAGIVHNSDIDLVEGYDYIKNTVIAELGD